ncbi:ras-related protein rab-5, putative [Leishmania panamensis]|uniref:Ras-related protein rab-5, putative n=1 Tax=Leishmania panamensis TaxID=5679 RepID=A0A088RPX9_LEIPA|nr:ras-related protein rab-5, putative [Leishmania panamensis]AIN97294.1 ras-related protein rab-5, putative [Leishmania panamensis]
MNTHPPQLMEATSAKIVMLGESGAGKSSIALRFARNEFLANQETTIGAAFLSKTVMMPPARGAAAAPGGAASAHALQQQMRVLKYEIWDTAGQERFRSLAPIYYRGACGALVVYDITNSESLKKAQTWIKELRANADPSLIIVLVGNKKDLESLRQVPFEDGQRLAAEEQLAAFYETSAKDNNNVEQVFLDLAGKLLDQGLGNRGGATGGARGGVIAPRGERVEQHNESAAQSTCC